MSARRVMAALGWPLFLGGCALGTSSVVDPGAPLRPAEDVPARFVFDPAVPVAAGDTIPGEGCRSPLYDPRDGTQIRMDRSARGLADYETPPGRYGVRASELLRLRCNTGEVLGIVRR
jgi:hypothetical protein